MFVFPTPRHYHTQHTHTQQQQLQQPSSAALRTSSVAHIAHSHTHTCDDRSAALAGARGSEMRVYYSGIPHAHARIPRIAYICESQGKKILRRVRWRATWRHTDGGVGLGECATTVTTSTRRRRCCRFCCCCYSPDLKTHLNFEWCALAVRMYTGELCVCVCMCTTATASET